jgi:outer membrane protein
MRFSSFARSTLALAAAFSLGANAFAAEGPLMVRVRALNLASDNKDSTGLGLSINNKTFPEVDFTYFLTPEFAAELVLTYPQKQTLYSNGSEIGTLKHLPPSLLAQYHFAPASTFRPYVGLGLNYTIFSSVNFAPAVKTALDPSIKKNSYGLAAQIGADIELSKGMYLNLDFKRVNIQTTVYSKGVEAGKFKIDPNLVSVGLGWRF